MNKVCSCGKEILNIKPSRYTRTKYCSRECQFKYHSRPSGLTYKLVKENPTKFKYTNGAGYRHKIGTDLADNCKCCGELKLSRLHVHHLDHNRLNNQLDNLVVLCRPCHLREHGRTERTYVEGRKAAM